MWSSVHTPHTLIEFSGKLLIGCFFLHHEQKIARDLSSNFFLMFNVSICALIVPKISVLKISRRFPNSSLVIPLDDDLTALTPFPTLALLPNYFLHNSTMSSNDFWDTSLDDIRFKISIFSSKIPFKKIVLMVSRLRSFLFFWRLYMDLST